MIRRIFLGVVLLFFGCNPSNLEDFQHEGASKLRLLLLSLQTIETREELSEKEPLLKKRFEDLANLIIEAREFQEKHPEEELFFLKGNEELNQALFSEYLRLYHLEGGKEIMERAQREALLRLDAFERILHKQKETKLRAP